MTAKTLSSQQFELLKEIVMRRSPDDRELLGAFQRAQIERRMLDRIIEMISIEFIEFGLSEGDEPNKYGIVLEEMLDSVNNVRAGTE